MVDYLVVSTHQFSGLGEEESGKVNFTARILMMRIKCRGGLVVMSSLSYAQDSGAFKLCFHCFKISEELVMPGSLKVVCATPT